jgi:acetate---CoA ligase (ADP-forming)
MASSGLERFVGAQSIAIVGASPRNVIARITIDNLTRWRFPGRVVGIHPSGQAVGGVECIPSLVEPIDLCVMAVGSRNLVTAVRQAGDAGVGAVVIPGAGANEGGRDIDRDLRAAVAETGLAVVGPNCMGLASLHQRVVPYVGTLDPDLQPGSVAIVSQSGSVCELFTSLPWRIGFSHVFSVGNELGVDLTEAIRFLVDQEDTRAIALFVEGIRRPEAFRRALLRASEAGKVVGALKVGRSNLARTGTEAHTGALAGDAAVFSAVLRDAGAVEVRDLDEMQALLELLGKGLRRPAGKVVYAGDSGGQANLFADLAADRGVELPALESDTVSALRDRFPSLGDHANPLDLWALDRPEAIYRDALPILLRTQPHLVVLGLDKFLARTEPERAFVRAGIQAVAEGGAVILMAYGGSDSADESLLRACWERGVPVVRGAERTLSSLAAIERWHRWRREPSGSRESADLNEARKMVEATPAWTEHAAKQLLAATGIPVTREEEVEDPDRAAEAAASIGFPVVAKIAGGGVSHKTEAGGVRLGLRSPQEAAAAARDLLSIAPRVLVAEHRSADLELIVSAFLDEQFGPCALIGLGGVWTEAFGEAVAVAGPGSEVTIRRALSSVPWGGLILEGARGRRFPVERVLEVCLRLIDLVALTGLRTIEINPLFLHGQEVLAVDALVVAEAQPRRGNRSRGS